MASCKKRHEWANLPGNLAEIYFAGRKGGMQTCVQVSNAFLRWENMGFFAFFNFFVKSVWNNLWM